MRATKHIALGSLPCTQGRAGVGSPTLASAHNTASTQECCNPTPTLPCSQGRELDLSTIYMAEHH